MSVGSVVAIEPSMARSTIGRRLVFRALDLGLVLPAIVLTLPVMLLVAGAVFVSSPGPVLYRSRRVTRNGRRFDMWKFRSMRPDADHALASLLADDSRARAEYERDRKLRHDPRVTRVGSVLRRWSLDELPQLFNVLFGHMSVVGPRPLLVDEVPLCGDRLGDVVAVKGGLTGLWQVSGRSLVSFADRLTLDVQYVRSRTVRGDLLIVWRTLRYFARGCPGAF